MDGFIFLDIGLIGDHACEEDKWSQDLQTTDEAKGSNRAPSSSCFSKGFFASIMICFSAY